MTTVTARDPGRGELAQQRAEHRAARRSAAPAWRTRSVSGRIRLPTAGGHDDRLGHGTAVSHAASAARRARGAARRARAARCRSRQQRSQLARAAARAAAPLRAGRCSSGPARRAAANGRASTPSSVSPRQVSSAGVALGDGETRWSARKSTSSPRHAAAVARGSRVR